jgi:hypothetical protein
MRKIIGTACLAVLASLVFVPTAGAVTVSPIIFGDIDANPGEAAFRTFTVLNETEEEQTYYLFARNFEPKGELGEVVVTEEEYGLSQWIIFDAPSVKLQPGESRDVQITVLAPENADPGGHYAAVFASTSPPSVERGVGLSGNVGTLMLVRVEGDITEDVRLLEFHTLDDKKFYNRLPVEFMYRLENRGTVHVLPQGKIKLNGWFGDDEINANPDNGRNLPNSIRRLEATWVNDTEATEQGGFFTELKNEWKNFAIGKYTAQLDITYGKSKQQIVGETTFWVFPWRVMLAGLVILIAIIVLIILYNKMVVSAATRKMKK